MKPSEPKKAQRGRPSSFDRDVVIEAVMNLFWDRGYKDLSFNEIAQETGLTRASLYNAFESKEALFMEVFKHYASCSPSVKLMAVQKGDSVSAVFHTLLDEAAAAYAGDKRNRGCLAVNIMNELITEDTDIGRTMAEMYGGLKGMIQKVVEQGVEQNELDKNSDVKITTNMIMTFLNGFAIISKTGLSEDELKSTGHCFLRQLGFATP